MLLGLLALFPLSAPHGGIRGHTPVPATEHKGIAMGHASRGNQADNSTRWAADRTFWAADRTLIAWVRTAISMIGFGIGIGKAGDYLETHDVALDSYHGLQIVGSAFIALAVLGIAGAIIQNARIERRLVAQGYGRVERVPLGLSMAILVLVVGIFGGILIFL